MSALKLVLPLVALLSSVSAQNCGVSDSDKVDCGFFGIDQGGCENLGCCWVPSDAGPEIPWCFFDADAELPCSDGFDISAPDAGFTPDFLDILYDNYKENLNVDGSGAVVAAPDGETPGGSYFYHWRRDAGLSIKAWIEINNNDLDTVRPEVEAYADWVALVHTKSDPNNDVRIEPKFNIPNADPYTALFGHHSSRVLQPLSTFPDSFPMSPSTSFAAAVPLDVFLTAQQGGWCRPQTDGPALAAGALATYGLLKQAAGEETDYLWGLVTHDLEWVQGNWRSDGCDLWEEVRSNDFYFNRMAFVYGLNKGAEFGDAIGQTDTANAYRTLAEEILTETEGVHWNGEYIYESSNRQVDGAVAQAIATFGEYGSFDASTQEVAATLDKLFRDFCREYPIVEADVTGGAPGTLIGRYPGDTYAGGNPWQLLTAVYAEVFYLGGEINLRRASERGADVKVGEDQSEWLKLLKLPKDTTLIRLAQAQLSAGDSVMSRLYFYVKDDGGRIDEQIDKFTGAQTSAQGLTWSYANILHAMNVRDRATKFMKEVLLQQK